MADHLEVLRDYNAWRRGDELALGNLGNIGLAIDAAIEEISRLRINEAARIATIQKWAAERVGMVDELERLRVLISDIKAWDVDQYMTIPHQLRTRMQAEVLRQDGDGVAGEF